MRIEGVHPGSTIDSAPWGPVWSGAHGRVSDRLEDHRPLSLREPPRVTPASLAIAPPKPRATADQVELVSAGAAVEPAGRAAPLLPRIGEVPPVAEGARAIAPEAQRRTVFQYVSGTGRLIDVVA